MQISTVIKLGEFIFNHHPQRNKKDKVKLDPKQ